MSHLLLLLRDPPPQDREHVDHCVHAPQFPLTVRTKIRYTFFTLFIQCLSTYILCFKRLLWKLYNICTTFTLPHNAWFRVDLTASAVPASVPPARAVTSPVSFLRTLTTRLTTGSPLSPLAPLSVDCKLIETFRHKNKY